MGDPRIEHQLLNYRIKMLSIIPGTGTVTGLVFIGQFPAPFYLGKS
jgi:hypothetical protein